VPENDAAYHGFDIRNTDDEALYESVKHSGVLEALTVSMDGFILSGHRRHWAALIAGLEHVPTAYEPLPSAMHMEANGSMMRRSSVSAPRRSRLPVLRMNFLTATELKVVSSILARRTILRSQRSGALSPRDGF
jgi:hypothetical protein